MAFNFFSMPQGPRIDTNLFANAATAGTNIGNALPTSTTAIIEGAMKGYERGLDLIKTTQEIQKNQVAIEQLPLDQAIKEATLKNQQIAAEIKDLELRNQLVLEQDTLNAERATLQATLATKEREKALAEKAGEFQKQYENASVVDRKKMIDSGKYNDVFADKPDVYNQAIRQIAPHLSREELEAARFNAARNSVRSQYDKQAEKDQQAYTKATNDIMGNAFLGSIATQRNTTPLDLASKVTIVPSGSVTVDAQGRVNHNFNREDVTGNRYDLLLETPTGGAFAAQNIDSETLKQLRAYQTLEASVTGVTRDNALRQIDKDFADEKKNKQVQKIEKEIVPSERSTQQTKVTPNSLAMGNIEDIPVVTPSGKINVAMNPKVLDNIRNILGLPQADFLEVQDDTQALLNMAKEAPAGRFGKYDSDQLANRLETIDRIATFTANKEFETNPQLQAEYTQAKVTSHNENVRNVKRKLADATPSGALTGAAYFNNIDEMQEVSTPEELYAVKRKGYFQNTLGKIFDRYVTRISNAERAVLTQGTSSTNMQKTIDEKYRR